MMVTNYFAPSEGGHILKVPMRDESMRQIGSEGKFVDVELFTPQLCTL